MIHHSKQEAEYWLWLDLQTCGDVDLIDLAPTPFRMIAELRTPETREERAEIRQEQEAEWAKVTEYFGTDRIEKFIRHHTPWKEEAHVQEA